MVSLCLCGFMFILGLVNAQFDILPWEYMERRTPHLGHTRHDDVVINNDPMGSQPFSGSVGPNRNPSEQGLVVTDGMAIDLATDNSSPFMNIVEEGSRNRLEGGYPPGGELNLGTAEESLGIGVERQHSDRRLGLLQRITGAVHQRAAGHRHHRGRWAGRRFRIGRYSQDSLRNGGQLAPEETWRDVPVSLVATDQGVPLAAGPGDIVGGSKGGP